MRKRLLAPILTLTTIATLLLGAGTAPASAYCLTSNGGGGGYIAQNAYESYQWSSTCDGLGDYYGKVIDYATDGHCVQAIYTVNGSSRIYYTCSETVWKTYSFTDSNANAPLRLCKVGSGGIGTCNSHANYNF